MSDKPTKKTSTISPQSPPPAALNKVEKDSSVNRRTFFSWLSLGWVAFVAATGGFFTMMLRFFFPNVLLSQSKLFEQAIQMIILLERLI